ncbi:hypothetical protein VNO77_17564 [Canavalia gladiata]|uniref:Uncharacterized protein n=1 Tax=Canavalia gladiata TaxID=3824 RepID=A0AAN9QMU0_CANGL
MGTCCGQRTENKQITAVTVKQNHTWSGKKMIGHDGLNTLECLRGRLLAERHASRVAKEEAQSMGKKFVELEKKLREEIKLRDKAERKLQLLKKKLESFNMSEKCENCCGSSSCCTASRHSESNETKFHTVNPGLLENVAHNHNVAEEYVLIQTQNSAFTTKDCGCQLNDAPTQSSENLKNAENRLSRSSSKSLAKSYGTQGSDDCSSNPSSTHAFPENICIHPNPR